MGYVLVGAVVVLLCSNLWLLKEVDRLRHRLCMCEREIVGLEQRVYRTTMELHIASQQKTSL